MKCPRCREEAQRITSRTGNIYTVCCAAMVGRAFEPPPQQAPMGRQEAILEIIRITRERISGTISREEHEARIRAITTREPELPLMVGR